MAEAAKKKPKKVMREPIESGCPDGMQYVHPVMLRNFGQWVHHTHPRPGVLCHVAESGEANDGLGEFLI